MEILSRIFESTEKTFFIKKSRREVISIREYVLDPFTVSAEVIQAVLNEGTSVSLQLTNEDLRIRLILTARNAPEASVLLDANEFLLKKSIKKKVTGYELEARVREIIPLHLIEEFQGCGAYINGNEKKMHLKVFVLSLEKEESWDQLRISECISFFNNATLTLSIQKRKEVIQLSAYVYADGEAREDCRSKRANNEFREKTTKDSLPISVLPPSDYKKWRGNFSIGAPLSPILETKTLRLKKIISRFIASLEKTSKNPHHDLLNPEFFYLPAQDTDLSLEIESETQIPSHTERSLGKVPIPAKGNREGEGLILAKVSSAKISMSEKELTARVIRHLRERQFKIIDHLPSPIPIVGAHKDDLWIAFYYISAVTPESMQGIIKDMRALRKLYPNMQGVIIVRESSYGNQFPRPLPSFLEMINEKEIFAK